MNIPEIGDVVSIGTSSEKYVVDRVEKIDDDINLLNYRLSLQKLNSNDSYCKEAPVEVVNIIEPYVCFEPLTSESKIGMTEEEMAEYFFQAEKEAKEIAERKGDDLYFSEIFFHGHMDRIYVWDIPNTLLQ